MSGTTSCIIITVKQARLALFIAITNLLLSAYYLLIAFRLSKIYSGLNLNVEPKIPNPFFNRYFLCFLALTLLSFTLWTYIRRRLRQGLVVNNRFHNIVLILLGSPIIYLTVQLIYFLVIIYIIFPQRV